MRIPFTLFRLVVMTALVALGSVQRETTRAATLIERFANVTLDEQMGMDPCSIARRHGPTVEALVELGSAALPELSQAIAEIEQDPTRSRFGANAEWLLLAYAHIQGRSAFERLQRLVSRPESIHFGFSADAVLGSSLGLTSYVSSSQRLSVKISCTGKSKPKDVVDHLILAWLQNDQKWIEASLGTGALAEWHRLVDEGWPTGARGALETEKPARPMAVGYVFKMGFGLDASTASSRASRGRRSSDSEMGNTEIETLFTDSSGAPCGKHFMKFTRTFDRLGRSAYLIDNSNLADILRTFTSCAVVPSPQP